MAAARTAVITGSTSGIGLAIAERMAADGCNVVVNACTDTAGDHAIAARLAERYGMRSVYVKADRSVLRCGGADQRHQQISGRRLAGAVSGKQSPCSGSTSLQGAAPRHRC